MEYSSGLTIKINPLSKTVQRLQRLLARPLIETIWQPIPIIRQIVHNIYTRRDVSCIPSNSGRAQEATTDAVCVHITSDRHARETGHSGDSLDVGFLIRPNTSASQQGCGQKQKGLGKSSLTLWPCNAYRIVDCQITYMKHVLWDALCSLIRRHASSLLAGPLYINRDTGLWRCRSHTPHWSCLFSLHAVECCFNSIETKQSHPAAEHS